MNRLIACTLALLAFAPNDAPCERLPIRVYSTADGLPHVRVNRIRGDSQGFIWFCTDGGLSRWDGYQFKSYATSDGLPHAHVNDFLETRGEYWIATDGGLARFYPERRAAPFVTYSPGASRLSREVNILLQDNDGTVLVGTSAGLYRLQQTSTGFRIEPEHPGFPASGRDPALVNALLLAHDGKLWVGAGSGIYRRGLDGHWRRFSTSNGLPENFINQLREDLDGQIWAGTRWGGLVELASEPDRTGSVVAQLFTKADGLPSNDVRDFLISNGGHMWVGTIEGLAETWPTRTQGRQRFQTHSIVDGLAEQSIYWLSEDPVGDLWLATGQTGAVRLSRAGFHTYAEADGFLPEEDNHILETRDGHLCVVNGDRSKRLVQCFERDRFMHRILRHGPNLQFGFEWHQFAIEDHSGHWWFATERGALRIPDLKAPAMTRHGQFLSTLSGSRGIWHVFEDSKGVIWMSEEGDEFDAVATWNPLTRATNILWRRSCSSDAKRTAPSCFLEDRNGQIWVGLSGEGGLLRRRRDHFDYFGREDGLPSGEITDIYQDRSGHIWVASTEGGLAQIADIAADHPHIRIHHRATGLSSDEIWCITEDRAGRIYAGTATGVDAINPATDRVVHYAGDDGLIPGPVRSCFCDHTGELWFVTNRGVSRFKPGRELPHTLPRVLITEFRIRGAAFPISQLGALQVGPVNLGPSQNQVAIDFVGMDCRLRGDLHYQYRLLGVDASWSNPAIERSVTFATIAPGRYRFEVRALDTYGGLSLPAVADFSISPPVWQRWWFHVLLAVVVAGILYWLHRYRTLRLLELERVRTRIATDLHDDIGSGLSQIAVLTEVARARTEGTGAEDLTAALSTIASVSRELSESMSDIVWIVNPRRDRVRDLMQRMRRFSSDLLSGRNIDLRFHVSVPEQEIHITPDVRREVYLIFKEAINNIVRHSCCTRVEIAVSLDSSWLELKVKDNGNGLAEMVNRDGCGMTSMRERASRIKGRLDFGSPEQGLLITLRVPLRPPT